MATIKAVGDWELDVLGVPFGGPNAGKDAHGEYFSADTAYHEDKFGLPPVVYYHGFGTDGNPSGEPQYIGRTVKREVRPDGVWYRVILDRASEYAKRVWEAAQAGIARASSGTVSHLRRVAPDGRITQWPVAELSVFDASGDRQPANAYAVAVPATKSVYARAGIIWPADIDSPTQSVDAKGAVAAAQRAEAAEAPANQHNNQQESGIMSDVDIKSIVAQAVVDALKAQRDSDEAARKASEARQAESAAAIQAAVEKAMANRDAEDAKAAPVRRLPGGGPAMAPVVDSGFWKYDHLTVGDLALAVGFLRQTAKSGMGRGASDNAIKALAVRLESDEARKNDGYVEAIKTLKASTPGVKANEIGQSTLASYGDEWVGVAWGTQLWESIRHGTPILTRQMAYAVPQPAGAETMYFPLESADPIWYKVAQADDLTSNPGGIPSNKVTASRLGTANQSRTMAKLGARVLWSGELEEDSVVNYVGELRRQLTVSGQEMLESLIINGDTATGASVNINDIADTPGGTEYWLALNGYRKLALVTNTANSRDGGALDEADFLATVQLMGLAGRNALGSDRVAFISDLPTYWKALDLTSVKTRDVNSAATIETGKLVRMWGYDYLPSNQMHAPNVDATYGLKANTAGKLDLNTASNNTKGALLSVRFDQWRPGYRRQMTMETTRFAAADATEIVAMMRFGMVYRDIEASAISYNLTV